MTIDIDKVKDQVIISMPGYIDKVLKQFQTITRKQTASPMIYTPVNYGQKTQEVIDKDEKKLDEEQKLYVQKVVGSLLYYARIIDHSMLTAVTAIGSEVANVTKSTIEKVEKLLNYAATYKDNKVIYNKSKMILRIQSDASYLSRSKSRSVVGGIAYLINNENNMHEINGAIQCLSNVIDVVVASAAEAEYAGVFNNARGGVWLRTVLEAMGFKQKTTTIICDNKCAVGLAQDTMKTRRSKSIDMRFHWIKDRVKQQQFEVIWVKGKYNLADFFTKALPKNEHQNAMKKLVYTPIKNSTYYTSKWANKGNAWREKIQDRRTNV